MACTPEERLRTATGAFQSFFVLLPSCPFVPAPQHTAPPALVTEHTVPQDREIGARPPGRLATWTPVTGTGVSASICVPVPTGAPALAPQHTTAPVLIAAHVSLRPAASAVTVVPGAPPLPVVPVLVSVELPPTPPVLAPVELPPTSLPAPVELPPPLPDVAPPPEQATKASGKVTNIHR
jgi:hypothetical protein